jgi:hypothetical protein
MPYDVPPRTKFSAIHLIGCGRAEDFAETELGDGLSVHPATFLKLTDRDKRRIGEDRVRDFENASVVLLAACPSAAPHVRDAEWLEIEGKAKVLLFALLLHGIPVLHGLITATGGVNDRGDHFVGRIAIDSAVYYRSPHVAPPRVGAAVVASVKDVAAGLAALYLPPSSDFVSVRRGFQSIIDGWRTRDVLDRLHQFVRALDGIMRLPPRAGAIEFGKRVALLAHGAFDVEALGREAYYLRNHDEHLTEWPDRLNRLNTPHERGEFVDRAAFYVEALATFAYRQILSNPTLRAEFRDKGSIEAFWAAGASSWGDRLDFDEQTKRFVHRGHGD